jgi:hypothetical protein
MVETIGQQQRVATDGNFLIKEYGVTDNRVNPIVIFFVQ